MVGIKHESMRKGQTSHKKEHNTRMCFPLKPVFTRDKGGLPNFIDEPTIGVDVVSKKYLHDFISEINREKGTTVLLTTHDMGDIEKLCSRVVVIDSGHLMYDGDLESMVQKFGVIRSLMIEFEEPAADFQVDNAKLTRSEGNRKWFSFHRSEATPMGLIRSIDDKYSIHDIEIIEPDIEEIVRKLYENK